MRAAIICLLLVLSLPTSARSEQSLRVAVAANFRDAAEQISARFTAATTIEVSLSSASTGTLYSQIVHGAPFDVLLAADSERPARLIASGQAVANSLVTYALGKLVLAYRQPLRQIAGEGGISAVLTHPGITLAIANPDLAPYGRAALDVLQRYPIDQSSRLLRGANIGQAFQMWHTGGADAALVAASYFPEDFITVPATWYQPIRQQAVILARTAHPEAARQYVSFLKDADSRSLIEDLGYAVEGPESGAASD